MVTLKDIARNAGVSYETVSRVLNGKYKGRTDNSRRLMKKILEVAARLNYRPNNAARAMRTSSTGLIGLVMEESSLRSHPVVTETLRGINESLEPKGYILTITSLSGIRESTLKSRIFREHLLDGIIIMDDISTRQGEDMRALIPASIMVNMNCWLSHCCIRRDEYHAGLTAGTELRKMGYTHAIYFDSRDDNGSSTPVHYSCIDRLSGFQSGFGGNGNHIEVTRKMPSDIHGYLKHHLNEISPRTVLVAAQDLRLFILTSSLSRLPISVGKDCGLASLDDETGMLASFPCLSRVSFPRFEIGRMAGQMMISLLEGKKEKCRSTTIKGEWICGSTTRKVG